MRAIRLAVAGALALGAGALCTYGAASALGLVGSTAGTITPAQTAPSVTVVMTRRPIAAGQVISAADLQATPWSSNQAPRDAHTRIDDVVGRVARQHLPADDLVLEPKLAALDARAGLSATIAMGKRAISVRVNDVVGVAGFALPGSYVDVLVSARDAAGQSFSRIVLERVKVLAAAQDTQADPGRPKVVNAVTLELAPAEAETLDLARAIGNLSLVLRNESDTGRSDSPGVRVSQLAAAGRGTPDAPVRRNAFTIPPAGIAPASVPVQAVKPPIAQWRGLQSTDR